MNAQPASLAVLGKVEKVEIPVSTVARASEPNPFVDGDYFPADDEALVFHIDGAKDSALVKKLTVQARKAAQAVDRTARVKVEQKGPKTKPVTTFTVWTIAKVTRPRGEKSSQNGDATTE